MIVTCQFSPFCNLWLLSDGRIPFPLDIVRTNRWNCTHFYIYVYYIGKILDRILPVGFHKVVTELWTLIDILQHENHYSVAIVRFSELDIAEACWPILFKFNVYRQKGSGQLNTILGQL